MTSRWSESARRYMHGDRDSTDEGHKWNVSHLNLFLRQILITLSRFWWAVCQLKTLQQCWSPGALQKTLNSLLKTLDKTYEQILWDIKEDNCDDVIKILQWLTYSTHLVTLTEVAEVVTINFEDEPRFEPKEWLLDPQNILKSCPSLVVISSQTSTSTIDYTEDSDCGSSTDMPDIQSVSDDSDDTDPSVSNLEDNNKEEKLELAYFSVKEYLISDRAQNSPVSQFTFDQRLAQTLITKTCLAYLLHFNSPTSLDFIMSFPLALYSQVLDFSCSDGGHQKWQYCATTCCPDSPTG
jgi:hypothetical protein